MEEIKTDHQTSVSRACRMARLPRSQAYYHSRRDDTQVIAALQGHTQKHPTHGFALSFSYLRKSHPWNHKRVYRLYCLLKLNLKRRGRRRLPDRVKVPLAVPQVPNTTWSMDFMSDALLSGRKFRTFNLIDDTTRKALVIEVDTSLPARRVVRSLEQAIDLNGKPATLRCDNGPEFISKELALYCHTQGITLQHTEPGKPTQNAFIERFNGTYRKEILDAYTFYDLDQVKDLTQNWIQEYNQERPHQSLAGKTPQQAHDQLLSQGIMKGGTPFHDPLTQTTQPLSLNNPNYPLVLNCPK